MNALCAALACLGFALTAASAAAQPEDPASASRPPAQPAPLATESPLTVVWEVSVPGTAVPWLAGLTDRVVVTSRDGAMAAYDTNGSPVWRVDLQSPVASAPVAVPGRIALLTRDGSLILIDSERGDLAARLTSYSPEARLSEVKGGLAVADPAGHVSLVSPESGSVAWSAPMSDPPSAPVAQCGAILLVGTAGGAITALDPIDGSILWSRELGDRITTAAGCQGNVAYVGSADNRLYAFKAGLKRANMKWSFLTGGDLVGQPFIVERRVLFFSSDTYLYAVKDDNGHLWWKARLGRRPQPHSALTGNLLVVAPLNTERLETFRLPEGTQAASITLAAGEGRFVSPPVVAGNRVAVAAAGYGGESSRVLGLEARLPEPQK